MQKLYAAYNPATIKLVWTRGHVGTELNELADEWANKAREMGLTNTVKVSEL